MSRLAKRSMLVRLHVAQWDGFKSDALITSYVHTQFNTKSDDAGTYRKRLFAKKVLNPIKREVQFLRKDHEALTLPYSYDGVAVLTSMMFMDWTEMFRERTKLFNRAVDNFIRNYDDHKRSERARLGDAYNEYDYPPAETVRSRFYVEREFYPVASKEHFLIDLHEQELEEIQQEYDTKLNFIEDQARMAVLDRICAVMNAITDRLENPTSIFRDKTIEAASELITSLPKLDLVNDPLVDYTIQTIKNRIAIHDPQELRINMAARSDVLAAASAIVNHIGNTVENVQESTTVDRIGP